MSMRYLLVIILLGIVAVSGCVAEQPEVPDNGDDMDSPPSDDMPPQEDEPPMEEEPPVDEPPETEPIGDVIALCDSLCETDADSYCDERRDIEINEKAVTGTCRAFARNGNVDGFDKCEGFCVNFDKSGTFCTVDGQRDGNCDGIVA